MTPGNSDIHTSSQGAKGERRRCDEIMTRNVITANPAMTLQQVAASMREGDMGVVPVVDETGKLVGVVTDRDIVIRAVADGLDLNTTAVATVMTTKIYAAHPHDFVFEAIRLMREKQVRRVPVIDENGKLEGILAMADIALEMEDEREIAETLEDISSGSAFWRKN
jgi:CBS domain-containing protein